MPVPDEMQQPLLNRVSAIDLGAPGWLVAVIAVGAVVIGIYAINVRKKMLTIQST